MRTISAAAVTVLAAALGSCAVKAPSLNVAFDAQGGGTYTGLGTASVVSLADAGAADVRGATVRAQTFTVTTWHGEFSDWRAVSLFGVTLEREVGPDASTVRMAIPLGPKAQWLGKLAGDRPAELRFAEESRRLQHAVEFTNVSDADLTRSPDDSGSGSASRSVDDAGSAKWDMTLRLVVPGRVDRGRAFLRDGKAIEAVPAPERAGDLGDKDALNAMVLKLSYDLIATSDATLVFEVSYVPDAAVEAAASRRATTRPGSTGR